MSVGLLFAMAAQNGGDPALFGMAVALALGIGIQNVPEGAAVALPMLQEGGERPQGVRPRRAFGLAEPVFGILVVLFAAVIAPYMPWMLAFSAGAMMYVVVEELIPRRIWGTHECGHPGGDGRLSGDDDSGRGPGIGAAHCGPQSCALEYLGRRRADSTRRRRSSSESGASIFPMEALRSRIPARQLVVSLVRERHVHDAPVALIARAGDQAPFRQRVDHARGLLLRHGHMLCERADAHAVHGGEGPDDGRIGTS